VYLVCNNLWLDSQDLSIHFFRCLAHVINLTMQVLIKGHSKSKHYDPAKPTKHLPDTDAFIHDEVGLVCAIAVKVSYMHTQKCYIIYHPYRSDLLPNERIVQAEKAKLSVAGKIK